MENVPLLSFRRIAIAIIAVVMVWAIAPPAHAAFCRTVNNHEICLLSVKRSAKNYWEYRASVSIDGEKSPIEVYNCRDRTRTQRAGSKHLFQPDGAGPLICNLFAA